MIRIPRQNEKLYTCTTRTPRIFGHFPDWLVVPRLMLRTFSSSHRRSPPLWVALGSKGCRGLVPLLLRDDGRRQVRRCENLRSVIGPMGGFPVIVLDHVHPRLFISCGSHRRDGYGSENPG